MPCLFKSEPLFERRVSRSIDPLTFGSALLDDSLMPCLLLFLFLFYTNNFCSCRLDEELREASEAANK